MNGFFADLVRYRPLLWRLAKSQLALLYRQSILGLSWAVIQPAAEMLIFTFVLHKGANVASEGGVAYPLFVYCGLLPWHLFSNSLAFGVPSLVQFANVVRKVYVPREMFPLSSIVTAFFNFGLASGLFIVLMIYFRQPVTWSVLWVVPLLLLQVVFTAGILMFGSALCVKYRDIRHGVAFATYMWMFISPVIWPLAPMMAKIPAKYAALRTVYVVANPIAAYLDAYRRVILQGVSPDFRTLGIAAAVSFLLFATGYLYFKRKEMTFADLI